MYTIFPSIKVLHNPATANKGIIKLDDLNCIFDTIIIKPKPANANKLVYAGIDELRVLYDKLVDVEFVV